MQGHKSTVQREAMRGRRRLHGGFPFLIKGPALLAYDYQSLVAGVASNDNNRFGRREWNHTPYTYHPKFIQHFEDAMTE
jgi:hypothetical protein